MQYRSLGNDSQRDSRSSSPLSIPLEVQLNHSDTTSENLDKRLYGDKDGGSASRFDDNDSSDAMQDDFW